MSQFEYTVIPAPARGEKTRDAKTPGGRYALTLTFELNRMARDGWEYIRADVLPSEERSGLTGRSTVYHNLLVFRRPLAVAAVEMEARQPQVEAPVVSLPQPEPQAAQSDGPASGGPTPLAGDAAETSPRPGP